MTDTPLPPSLSSDELDELDQILSDLGERTEEIPQWEFCDGFLTALVCMRRRVEPAEYLPMLLDDGAVLDVEAGAPLPLLPAFQDGAQQERFLQLWQRRWDEVAHQLAADVQTLDDEQTYQPHALDMRGAVAMLSEAERAELEGQELPSLGQIWALGFMFAVENWPEEWAAPRDKEAAQWIDAALESIVALTEDDLGPPSTNLYDEEGPASVSQDRIELLGEAIWAVYDLRQVWKSLGPRIEPVVRAQQPGRNDPCWCGSGKKFKKCHGA